VTPLYLTKPVTSGCHLHGTIDYDPKQNNYILRGEPAVMELAKRVFPGCDPRRSSYDGVSFKATRRAAGDLNWLLLRFPMEIRCPQRLDQDRAAAIEHAERREANATLEPVTTPAGFVGELLDYQGAGVSFLLANQRCLLADDMGLGKTVQALAALGEGRLFPVLIVGTTQVMPQWERMAQTFLSITAPGEIVRRPPACAFLRGRKARALPPAPIYITHYGLVHDWVDELEGFGFKAVIFDEIQELRRGDSNKYSACVRVSRDVEHVFGLSGTPIYNYGAEIWSILNVLDYHCLGDLDSFKTEWCTGYQSSIVAKPDILGDYLKREGLMLRRRKADVQGQLPPKRRVVNVIGHEQNKYNDLIKNAVKLARSVRDVEDWTERGRMVRQIDNEARKATGIAKAPMVADFVRPLLEADEKVLLFAYHHDVHDILRDTLKEFKPVFITGRETPAEKKDALEKFQKGETNLVVLSLRTAAGLDGLQQRGTCVVFGELDWSPAVHAQCEDRLQRIGTGMSDSILCYYLVTDTGSDEVMQEALGLKIGQFVGLMGDKAETTEDREMAGREAVRHLEGIVSKLLKGRSDASPVHSG
jgi:SWI/SNF-related matrix-associated actin-dependent regulator 1 of chromatin subfamily A